MNLQMFAAEKPEALPFSGWTQLIVGEERDDRGGEARKYADRHGIPCVELTFDSTSSTYTFGGVKSGVDELDPLAAACQAGHVLVDSTTIGFVELLLVIRAAKIAGVSSLHVSYVEPGEYSSQRSRGVLHARDFILSAESELFSAVPGSSLHLSKKKRRAILVVGYEGDRLQKVLEQTPIEPEDCVILLGVPAFQAGWEMNSYANVVNELDERGINSTIFAGATNPLAVYRQIERVHRSCAPDERLVVIPIGTKPHGLGVALYCVDHADVGLVYDNPAKKKGRTKLVGRWHLYCVNFK